MQTAVEVAVGRDRDEQMTGLDFDPDDADT
jgi:hypothetical protein